MLETMLKQAQDRLKRGETEKSGIVLETENRYLRDIKQISESFEAYKRQVERWRGEVKQERDQESKKHEDLEANITRLKQNIRAQANHHEVNTKRMREKITKLENDFEESQAEAQKLKTKLSQAKIRYSRLQEQQENIKTGGLHSSRNLSISSVSKLNFDVSQSLYPPDSSRGGSQHSMLNLLKSNVP